MKRQGSKRAVHGCGGGYEAIDPAMDGRPRFRCTKCGQTWTDGTDGGDSLLALKGTK